MRASLPFTRLKRTYSVYSIHRKMRRVSWWGVGGDVVCLAIIWFPPIKQSHQLANQANPIPSLPTFFLTLHGIIVIIMTKMVMIKLMMMVMMIKMMMMTPSHQTPLSAHPTWLSCNSMVEQLDKILLFIVIQLHKILLFIVIQRPQTSLFVKLVHHRRLVFKSDLRACLGNEWNSICDEF